MHDGIISNIRMMGSNISIMFYETRSVISFHSHYRAYETIKKIKSQGAIASFMTLYSTTNWHEQLAVWLVV